MRSCAIVGASDFNSEAFQEMNDAEMFHMVMAVDAGFAHLEKLGIKPDIVIGDFDSLGYVPKGVRTLRFSSHKDHSDMELALNKAKSLKYDRLYIFGALGGRLDHTLANLQVFSRLSEEGLDVMAIDETTSVSFVTGPDVFTAPAQSSGTVSVFSMSDACTGVFERGMVWELDDVELSNRTSLGLSNELTGEAVMIGVESGTIAIIFPL